MSAASLPLAALPGFTSFRGESGDRYTKLVIGQLGELGSRGSSEVVVGAHLTSSE